MEVLKINFPDRKIYGERIEQGAVFPCFFVYVVPLSHVNHRGTMRKQMSIKIVHMYKEKSNKNNYVVLDKLNELFDLTLKVSIRSINVVNTTSQTIDGDLHFSFTIDFFDYRETTTDIEESNIPNMDTLHSKLEVK